MRIEDLPRQPWVNAHEKEICNSNMTSLFMLVAILLAGACVPLIQWFPPTTEQGLNRRNNIEQDVEFVAQSQVPANWFRHQAH